MSQVVQQKLARLQHLVAQRSTWAEQIERVKSMRQWILDAEHIFSGSWAHAGESVSNENVSQRFDAWRTTLAGRLTDGTLSTIEMECLTPCLQVLTNLRPYLIHCYDDEKFPRTNNETEREIRALKTNYRRISGRKNWNSYLLRYGRCVVFSAWWQKGPERSLQLEHHLQQVTPERWRRLRRETVVVQSEQLKRTRFRRKRTAFLASLEHRWACCAQSVLLP